jgi:hypothetical protein
MCKSIHFISIGGPLFALIGSAWAADPPATPAPAMHRAATADGAKSTPTDDELIASARKAATIVVPDPKGGMRTLRSGTNSFTCMPDNPETPGPDPMCWDRNSGPWIDAQDTAYGQTD